jgi:hypothetical protein
MKLKFWQFEYEFDRDDAKVIVPIILLLMAISTTSLSPLWLLGAAAVLSAVFLSRRCNRSRQSLSGPIENALSQMQQQENIFAGL